MRIGVMTWGRTGPEAYRAELEAAAAHGLATAWTPHVLGWDALGLIGGVGPAVPGLELGTAVVPVDVAHPVALAMRALTTNALVGGRLTLGLGASHRFVVEGVYGLPYDRPADRVAAYLERLRAAFGSGLKTPGAVVPSLLVAAMGPRMCRVAGELADGTITWLAGAKAIEGTVLPNLGPGKRVVAGLPVCVTADPEAARVAVAESLAVYGEVPAYRDALGRSGAAGPADVALVGDEDAVAAGIDELRRLGVDDFYADLPADPADRARTLALLAALD